MSQQHDDDFYIGYLPKAPQSLGKWLRIWVIALLLGSLVLGGVMIVQQKSFGPGVFEFQNYRDFEGVIVSNPAPALLVSRPGDKEHQTASLYYLVVFGKKGGQQAIAEFVGQRVSLRGALLFRDNQTMIELENGAESIKAIGPSTLTTSPESKGVVTLQGEIVDSKCYFGLMKPGNLKTHKACAIRCISGGIPPVLLIRNQQGDARYVLLVGPNGEAVNDRVLNWVAEPVEIMGTMETWGSLHVLKADPAGYRKPKM